MENWKKIKDYPSYSVSDMGRVRNDNTGHIKVANIFNQYPQVTLNKDKKLKSRFVHKLVADAFLDRPSWAQIIIHIDGNKENAKLSNLKWSTWSETCKHAHKIGLNKTAEKQGRWVNQLTLEGVFIAKFPSIREAERQTGVHRDGIGRCAKNEISHSGGFKWEYINPRKDKYADHIDGELWAPIAGFPRYSVSSIGRIRIDHSNKLMNLQLRGGYYKTQLWNSSKILSVSVHRLVAEAFIPNSNNYTSVNHINGIKNDNHVKNLEWCSFSENSLHAVRTGLNKSKEYSSKKVECLTLDDKHVAFYNSIAEAGRSVNRNPKHIGAVASCKTTRRSTAAGYKWRFVA